MGQVQNALLGAAGAVASAGLVGKKAVGQKKTEAEKQASNSPSAIAAQKAKASLSEHREAKKRGKIGFMPHQKEKLAKREMKDFL